MNYRRRLPISICTNPVHTRKFAENKRFARREKQGSQSRPVVYQVFDSLSSLNPIPAGRIIYCRPGGCIFDGRSQEEKCRTVGHCSGGAVFFSDRVSIEILIAGPVAKRSRGKVMHACCEIGRRRPLRRADSKKNERKESPQ